jgi:ligand-binding sensor domain-containing protein/class 3 adenylate cyclase
MKDRITIVIVILLLLIFHEGVTQKNEISFTLVNGISGKPLGKVNAITQDSHGYMWFSGDGEKCLYRYDGNRMIAFRNENLNPNSLGSTKPETVYADDSGIIWIGFGDAGLDQFNPATGNFKHFSNLPNDSNSLSSNTVNAILRDRQGRLWVGTQNGLDRLDEKTGKFLHYRNEPGNPRSLSNNVVRAIYEDRGGVIWIGTGYPFFKRDPDEGGLNRLEPDGKFTRYLHNPKDPHSLINNKVRAIFEDSRGVFWIGTNDDGLHTMDRKTGSFERHLYDPAKPDKLSRPPLKQGEDNDQITFIREDCMGMIWIGTMVSGINRYDTATKKIIHFKHSNGFPDNSGWNAFTSRDGVLWISTQENNLYRVDPFHKSVNSISTGDTADKFPGAVAGSFLEDKEGYLWVGTLGNGLFKYDQHRNLIQQFKHDPLDSFSISDNKVGSLFQNQEDKIWVGTGDGVRMHSIVTKQFSRFHDGGNLKDTNIAVFKILQDKQGLMWFSRWGLGLIRYNPSDNSLKHFLSDAKDSASLISNEAGDILEDRSGVLWVGGAKGISRLNRETGHFKHYIVGTWITALYEDSEGNLWAGTGNGLFRYDPKEDKFSDSFDPQQEINSFTVGGITEDNAKNLWLATQIGMIKLNPFTNQTFIYDSRFGIDPNSLVLWARTYQNRKGQMFIPRADGFYTFSPEELAVKTDFQIIITDLFINNLPVLLAKGSPIQKPVEETSVLVLKYNQNNIAFNFAAIDYRHPEATRYFTMLENYDNTWREAKGDKSSYYFNVPPGKYVYRVKAFNVDGTKAEKAITVTVNPPFWQTWWFKTLIGVFLAASLYTIYRWRTASLRRQKRKLEQTVKIRTAEVVKQKEKSDELLLNILPSEVAEELKEKGYTTARSFDEVTVLFSDIKGFTNVAEKMTAQQLVKEIDTYFSAFDNIMVNYGLEKIKTIGDAYIAAGGLPEKNSATAHNVIEAAIAMQQEVEKLKQERVTSNKPYFELRIGVHTGPVVAGVVGIKKFQYDIWGDTVNLAARMEQSGVPGKINISQQTYELVKEQFNFVHRGKIEAKNKGDIDMYFVD